MIDYEATAEKIVFHVIDPATQQTSDLLFSKDEVEILVEGADMWFTFEGKKYLTIDHPDMYEKAGFIRKKATK